MPLRASPSTLTTSLLRHLLLKSSNVMPTQFPQPMRSTRPLPLLLHQRMPLHHRAPLPLRQAPRRPRRAPSRPRRAPRRLPLILPQPHDQASPVSPGRSACQLSRTAVPRGRQGHRGRRAIRASPANQATRARRAQAPRGLRRARAPGAARREGTSRSRRANGQTGGARP